VLQIAHVYMPPQEMEMIDKHVRYDFSIDEIVTTFRLGSYESGWRRFHKVMAKYRRVITALLILEHAMSRL
jgi:hypothetical protein